MNKYIIFDTETTGLTYQDEMIEFAAIKVIDGRIVDAFTSLIKTNIKMTPEVIRVHGITNKMLANEPTVSQIMPYIIEFLEDFILVAHNASFDMRFLTLAAKSCGYDIKNQYIDTLACARRVLPHLPNHKLETIKNYFGSKHENAHRALSDCYCLNDCFIHFLPIAKDYIKEYKSQGSYNNSYNPFTKNDIFVNINTSSKHALGQHFPYRDDNFVVSGIFKNITYEEIRKKILKHKGNLQASISESTNFFVVGQNPDPEKINDYYKLIKRGSEIKMLSETEFRMMF